MVHICNPSTEEAEAETAQVREQPGLQSTSLFQKTNNPPTHKKKHNKKLKQTKQNPSKQTEVTSEHPKFLLTGTSITP